jgi:hypothetical protein
MGEGEDSAAGSDDQNMKNYEPPVSWLMRCYRGRNDLDAPLSDDTLEAGVESTARNYLSLHWDHKSSEPRDAAVRLVMRAVRDGIIPDFFRPEQFAEFEKVRKEQKSRAGGEIMYYIDECIRETWKIDGPMRQTKRWNRHTFHYAWEWLRELPQHETAWKLGDWQEIIRKVVRWWPKLCDLGVDLELTKISFEKFYKNRERILQLIAELEADERSKDREEQSQQKTHVDETESEGVAEEPHETTKAQEERVQQEQQGQEAEDPNDKGLPKEEQVQQVEDPDENELRTIDELDDEELRKMVWNSIPVYSYCKFTGSAMPEEGEWNMKTIRDTINSVSAVPGCYPWKDVVANCKRLVIYL